MLALSPDGQWLAARIEEQWGKWGRQHEWGAVWLANLSDGESRVVTSGPAVAVGWNGLGCLAFSPDSKLLAVCGVAGRIGVGGYTFPESDYALQLWDVSTGKEQPGYLPHGDVGFVAFSPDGTFLAASP